MKKLFGGNDQDQEQQVQQQQAAEKGPDNSDQLSTAGLDQEEEQSNWLSRAWNGMQDTGRSLGNSMKNGGIMGGGIGAIPTGAIGAGIGAGIGRATGEENTGTGAKIGAVLLGAPGALVGGLIGALAGAGAAIKDEMTYDEEALLAATADIPGYHVILEQLAHTYAYGDGDMQTLESWGYELASEHEDKNSGFRVVGFKPMRPSAMDPDGKPLKPVVAFRGTANGGGALDDINDQGIGTFQFSRNQKEIQNVITTTKGSDAPDVTGHSLGGALAQLCAARLGSMVGNIITFQAAGINGAEAQRIDSEQHKATHYRTGGDLVHSGGEAFALGEVIQFNTKGLDTALSHLTYPLAELNALRGSTDADVPVVEGARSGADEWEWNKAEESTSETGLIDDGKRHHNGRWKSGPKTKSMLHSVQRSQDANDTEQSGIVKALGGRKGAGKVTGAIAKTGVASRQQDYAKAWRQIRAMAMTVKVESDIPGVRSRIVDLVIELGVQPRDHGKFIGQAEAAMLDALEANRAAEVMAPESSPGSSHT